MDQCQCALCYKQLRSMQALKYHIDHNVCNHQSQTNNHICIHCRKPFSSKQKLNNHIEKKICLNKSKIKLSLKTTMTVEELHKENIRLESRLAQLEEHPQNQIIKLNFPRAFRSEQIIDILGKLPTLLHDAITQQTGRSIEYLTEQIHCNQKVFPEYTNIYIDQYKSPFVFVSNGERFQTKPRKRFIEQIIEDSISMLQEYVDNNGEKCGQKFIEKYETYRGLIKDGDKKSQRRKDLELEIAGMLLDMRPIIEARHAVNELEKGPLGADTP